jgi:hypothetical protein
MEVERMDDFDSIDPTRICYCGGKLFYTGDDDDGAHEYAIWECLLCGDCDRDYYVDYDD